jgi:uncharacterized repeat protein (TIGR03803 family)
MSENEGQLHHAQPANLAAMARSIFHQVGATEIAQRELTSLVSFNGSNGREPLNSLIADPHGDLFGTTGLGGSSDHGTVFEIAETAQGFASAPTTLINFKESDGFVSDRQPDCRRPRQPIWHDISRRGVWLRHPGTRRSEGLLHRVRDRQDRPRLRQGERRKK